MDELEISDGMEIEDIPRKKKIKKKINNEEIKNFSHKISMILKQSKFDEKRSSKLHWGDFLELL